MMEVMDPNVFSAPPELKSPLLSDLQGRPEIIPPHIPASPDASREAALRWARNHELKCHGATIRVYQDVSKALAKKRTAFNASSRLCIRTMFHLL